MLAFLRRLPFWSLILLSATIYLIYAFWFPLLPHYNVVPVADVFVLARPWWQGLLYGLLLTALFAIYLLAWQRVKQVVRPVPYIFASALIFIVPQLLTFPINSTDIFRYFIRGRVASTYGASPYVFAPTDFATDPYLALAGEWDNFTSPYGPLWELWAFAATTLARWLTPNSDDLLPGLLIFKIVGGLAFFLTGFFIYRIWQRKNAERAAERLLLWLWNPALLLTFVANGHNDSFMLLLFVLGWLWVERDRPVLAWCFFLLAVLTKPIGLLALPFLFLYLWRRQWSEGHPWRFALITGSLSLAFVTLAFYPFGSPLDLAIRLIVESSSFPSFSIVTLLILIRNQLLGPGLFAPITNTALGIFALFTLILLWQGWRGRSALRGAADIFYLYILQATSFRIWYAAWTFPWLLLDDTPEPRTTARLKGGILFLYMSQLSVIIYAHIRKYLFAGQHLWAHAIAIPLVFIAPLILVWWANRYAADAN